MRTRDSWKDYQNHQDDSKAEISLNNEKSSGELRKVVVIQTSVQATSSHSDPTESL